MKRLLYGILFFGLLFFSCTKEPTKDTGKKTERDRLLSEYEAAANRITYASTAGFCFDGVERVPEIKTDGSEATFFVEEPNIFLKVVRESDKKIFYTRCFRLQKQGKNLTVEGKYRLAQNISITGRDTHWSLLLIGGTLNMSICSGESCNNIKLDLYQTNETPLEVTDGILLTFAAEPVKAEHASVSLNASALPDVDITAAADKLGKILTEMEKHFTADELKEQKAFYDKTMMLLSTH